MADHLLSAAERSANALHLPLRDEAHTFLRRRQARDRLRSVAVPLDAGGLPVMLVGGLFGTSWLLEPLWEWFDLVHCHPTVAPIRWGVDCGERTTVRYWQRWRNWSSTRVGPR